MFNYLDTLGVLNYVINSASILTLTLDEIIERKNYIESIGQCIIEKNKFNSIFGLSRKKFNSIKNEKSKKLVLR